VYVARDTLEAVRPAGCILVAANILWSGGFLLGRSAVAVLDDSDPDEGNTIRAKLDAICVPLGITDHDPNTGSRQIYRLRQKKQDDRGLARITLSLPVRRGLTDCSLAEEGCRVM
jgi:hypothetical protein